MNNLKIGSKTLAVNADSKTKEYLNEWILKKKNEWINQQKGLEKEINYQELEEKESKNEMVPWIEELISKYAGDIYSKFEEILGLTIEVSFH